MLVKTRFSTAKERLVAAVLTENRAEREVVIRAVSGDESFFSGYEAEQEATLRALWGDLLSRALEEAA